MPCYLPLKARQYISGKTGKTVTDFHSTTPNTELPCGRCLGCKLSHAKEWALRCWHENQTMELAGYNSCFVTLTYDDQHLPPQLNHLHFQKFIRALRKSTKQKIRYFMCGEYGEKFARPHYHAILFGYRPTDLKLVNIRNDSRNYTSASFARYWPHGAHEIGYVSYKNAGYVARYTLKKQTLDKQTGELPHDGKTSPYIRMSLKPGIGFDWFEQFQTDLFPHDFAITPDGRQTPVPGYYRKLLERTNPTLATHLRDARVENAKTNTNNTPERLDVRHTIQKLKATRLKREL